MLVLAFTMKHTVGGCSSHQCSAHAPVKHCDVVSTKAAFFFFHPFTWINPPLQDAQGVCSPLHHMEVGWMASWWQVCSRRLCATVMGLMLLSFHP